MTTCCHMKCPFCSKNTKVYNSRDTHQETQIWRRRNCQGCNKTFTTKEKVDWTGLISVRTPKDTSEYSRERLQLSLVRASDKLNLPTGMIAELADSIEVAMHQAGFFSQEVQESELITTTSIQILARYNRNLALQYINHVYSNQPPLRFLRALTKPQKSSG